MSYAKDDVGLQISTNRVQAVNINQTLKNSENIQPTSVSHTQEQVTEVVELSDKASKLSNNSDFLDQIQVGKNLLEIANQGLSSILKSLSEIKNQAKKGQSGSLTEEDWKKINDNIKKELENIQETVDNTSFNDIKPLDGSSYDNMNIDTGNNGKINISSDFKDTSLKSLNLPEVEDVSVKNKEEADSIIRKVNVSIEEIKKRQENIESNKKELDNTVNNLSIITIEFPEFESPSENKDIKMDITNQLKETVVKSIYEKPEISVKIHQLSGSMLLALLSFSGASKF